MAAVTSLSNSVYSQKYSICVWYGNWRQKSNVLRALQAAQQPKQKASIAGTNLQRTFWHRKTGVLMVLLSKEKEQMENKAENPVSKHPDKCLPALPQASTFATLWCMGPSVDLTCWEVFIKASVAVVTAWRADQMDARTRWVSLRTPHTGTIGADPFPKGYQHRFALQLTWSCLPQGSGPCFWSYGMLMN